MTPAAPETGTPGQSLGQLVVVLAGAVAFALVAALAAVPGMARAALLVLLVLLVLDVVMTSPGPLRVNDAAGRG